MWLGFHGGKGVATSWGVMLALDPAVAGITTGVFGALYAAFRIASIGSMVAAVAFAPLVLAFDRGDEVVALAIALAGLILVKHRDNLGRLLRGAEHKV